MLSIKHVKDCFLSLALHFVYTIHFRVHVTFSRKPYLVTGKHVSPREYQRGKRKLSNDYLVYKCIEHRSSNINMCL